jgi:hypothetical protein
VTAGIGHGLPWDSVAGAVGNFGAAVGKAALHGLAQGGLSEIGGGDFASGFIGGAFGSMAGSAIGYAGDQGYFGGLLKDRGAGGIVLRTSIAATVGGTAAALGGGSFTNGAISAAFVHLFNDEMRIINHVKNILVNAVRKAWNTPNTVLGLLWGGLGMVGGAKPTLGNNAIQFENHPFMPLGAITIGNTIHYPQGFGPDFKLHNGVLGKHEMQHTYQGEMLGPLYIPSNILGLSLGGIRDGDTHGPSNWNERGPQSKPARPW